jgi:hypothetical protein
VEGLGALACHIRATTQRNLAILGGRGNTKKHALTRENTKFARLRNGPEANSQAENRGSIPYPLHTFRKGGVEMSGLKSQSGLPSAGLDFLDRTTVHLGSGTYRWLDLKRFTFAVALSNDDAVKALLRHERYQDHYATNEANWTPTGDLHGPYRLGAIGVEAFEAVSPSDARPPRVRTT